MPKRRQKKTVTVVNRKGGVGKSFIADEIAWALERDGVACAFWDFDGQGGTGHETSDAEEREAAEVYVVDTPGAITRQMRDLLKQTDVAVVPVTPVGSDVSATEYTMDVVESACPKAAKIVVVNAWTRFRTARAFEERADAWRSRGWEVRYVPNAEAVRRARDAGRSVCDVDRRCKAARAVSELCERVEGLVSACD